MPSGSGYSISDELPIGDCAEGLKNALEGCSGSRQPKTGSDSIARSGRPGWTNSRQYSRKKKPEEGNIDMATENSLVIKRVFAASAERVFAAWTQPELRELGDNETELTLTHVGFAKTDVRDNHEEGWNGCLDKLPAAL